MNVALAVRRDARDEASELARRGEGLGLAIMDDRPGDPPRRALLSEIMENVREPLHGG